MNRFKYYAKHPNLILVAILNKINFLFPDSIYLRILYLFRMGKVLDLKNPKRFTEKIQWLKLYGFKSEYTELVDKYSVKKYVSDIIGPDFVIPTLGVWNNVNDIEWDSLPNQFVLKTTHGGGGFGVVICHNKDTFDKEKASKKLEKSLQINAGIEFREKPYIMVSRKIIAEKFIVDKSVENNTNFDIPDYKFYCFYGEPKYCQVIQNRQTKETIDFFDMEWNRMPFVGLNSEAKNCSYSVEKPKTFGCMKDICEKLSKDIPFCRIDLYSVENKVYFGEITFYPSSGLGRFTPDEWDYKLGEMLKLPFPIENI